MNSLRFVRFVSLLIVLGVASGTALAQRPSPAPATLSRGDVFQSLRRAMAAAAAGQVDQGRRLAEDALRWADDRNDDLARAWARQTIGCVEFHAENWPQAQAAFESALEGFQKLNKLDAVAACETNLGNIAAALGQPDEALVHHERAVAILRKQKNSPELARALADLAHALKAAAKTGESVRAFEEALNLRRSEAAADAADEVRILTALGTCYLEQGSIDRAVETLAQAGRKADSLDQPSEQAAVQAALGMAYHQQGKHDQALAEYQAALAAYTESGDRQGQAATRNNLGSLYRDLGKFDEALAELEASLELARTAKDQSGQSRAWFNLALLHEDGGDVQRAQAAYEKCLAIRRQQNDLAGVAKTLDNLGLLFTTAGNQDRAKACFDEAQQIRDAR